MRHEDIVIQLFKMLRCCHQVFRDRMQFNLMILEENVGHRRLTRYEFNHKILHGLLGRVHPSYRYR